MISVATSLPQKRLYFVFKKRYNCVMNGYEELSLALTERMKREKRDNSFIKVAECVDNAIRRVDNPHDSPTIWRPAYVRDTDKIMNCPYYNRYADKTQVFSFYKNDDITRRGLHVQLVSRIARTIGSALNLNVDLIEAIALGHDIGHTPFGHAGERFLDELSVEYFGRHFAHNLHSVRVLDGIYPLNISLQTLCGIAAHDGELELKEYRPQKLTSFAEFDKIIKECYRDSALIKKLLPNTLEGCVVRISDIIAYVGKDRQDAERAHIASEKQFSANAIGAYNAQIINNLMVNIIENSYGKDYIAVDKAHFEGLKIAKAENYERVYRSDAAVEQLQDTVRPMMREIFKKLLSDLEKNDIDSPIYRHHIDYVNSSHYRKNEKYGSEPPQQIVIDYIACMTDDYFVDLYRKLFPSSALKIAYRGYFD